MRVLVSAASKHGATTEVAATIAAALASAGLDAVVMAPADVTSLDGVDAAIVGSGVYAGHWLQPAKDLLARHRDALAAMPVWLFSSGPIGDPPLPAEDPVDAAPMAALIGARGHRVFAGEIDRAKLGFAEKAILAAVRAKAGDYRPWPAIESWAGEIVAVLKSPAAR